MSELTHTYVFPCRMYHCYRESKELTCKRIEYPEFAPLQPPYTDTLCVRHPIPLHLDKWALLYASIPSHVHIVNE